MYDILFRLKQLIKPEIKLSPNPSSKWQYNFAHLILLKDKYKMRIMWFQEKGKYLSFTWCTALRDYYWLVFCDSYNTMLALFVTVVLNEQEKVCIYSLLARRYISLAL